MECWQINIFVIFDQVLKELMKLYAPDDHVQIAVPSLAPVATVK